MFKQRDLYEVLRVHPSASTEEIYDAYHRVSLLYIDEFDGALLESEITEDDVDFAFEILSDPQRRAEYDASRMERRSAPVSKRAEELAKQDYDANRHLAREGSVRKREARWMNLGSSRASGKLEHLGVSTHDLERQGRTFVVRYVEGKLEFYIHWGTEVSYSPTIEVYYQIDDRETKAGEWQVYDDIVSGGKLVYMHPTEEQLFRMYDSEELKVWIHPFGGSEMVAMFSLEGLRDAVLPVLAARDEAGGSGQNPTDAVTGSTASAIVGLATTAGLLGIAAVLMHFFGGGAQFFLIGMIMGVDLAVPLARKKNQTARFLWNHRGLFYGSSVLLLLIAYNPGELGSALFLGIPAAVVVYAFSERNRQRVARGVWNVFSYVTLITLAAAAMVMFLDHAGKNKKN